MSTNTEPVLSQSQKSLITKAKVLGSGTSKIELDDPVCSYLVGAIAQDLDLMDIFPEYQGPVPGFYDTEDVESLRVDGVDFNKLVTRLFAANRDADCYFSCLANIHKRRLKYGRILRTQPFPTIDQVGPRGLLQFGSLTPGALTGLLFWRKWVYDIDNRAAQETGYLFEPIITSAIGGAPVIAKESPVRRANNPDKGRQVDCIVDRRAYEFKLRITIAASGQGRWSQELQFPADCRSSNHTPVLIVLDGTPSDKLAEISAEFKRQNGEVFTGDDAWAHLQETAGPTMSTFLEKYVRQPIDALLGAAETNIADLSLRFADEHITISIGDEDLIIPRNPTDAPEETEMPGDVAAQLPGL